MKRILVLAVMAGVFSAAPASAQLERVGPTVPANGFPAWYQDKTGIVLEFCQPLNQAELDGGWCLLLPADTTVPEVFPTRFADEHFFYAADAFLPGGGLLVIGLEAAFAVGPVIPGDQIVFARIRIRIDGLTAGATYRVRHPYGMDDFVAAAGKNGGEINYTEDIGIQCLPGQFDCALQGRIGPFLLPSLTPGGTELAPINGPVPGKLYIADPAREGPVTGSPVLDLAGVPQNYFRLARLNADGTETTVEETSNFALMGRVFTGGISGKVTVDRASYGSDTVGNKLDVFATAFAATQTRLPASPTPPAVAPLLAFFPGACDVTPAGTLGPPAGVPGVQMLNDGANYFAQIQPAVIPPAVCVGDLTARDATGQIVPLFSQKPVTDQITVQTAGYTNGLLSVQATSSDLVNAPTLTVLGYGEMASGAAAFSLLAPPSAVRVSSSKGGQAELLVTTGIETAPPAQFPIAVNDAYTVLEDSGLALLSVVANDTYNGAPLPVDATVNLVGPAALGQATVNGQQIAYTPFANAWGSDALAYTVTVLDANGVARTSPAAFVSITITGVNDAPVAVDDVATAVANLPININVLANDTDVDGAADLSHAEILTPPTGATATAAGGVITFLAATPGTYTFTYMAFDLAGEPSAPATVTVNVTGNETLTVTRAEFVRSTLRWRVEGTSSLRAGQTITIAYDNGSLRPLGTSLSGYVISTAVVDATGAWGFDLRLTSATDPRNPNATNLFIIRPNRIRASSPLGGFTTAAIVLK
jgi:hypothetical protein